MTERVPVEPSAGPPPEPDLAAFTAAARELCERLGGGGAAPGVAARVPRTRLAAAVGWRWRALVTAGWRAWGTTRRGAVAVGQGLGDLARGALPRRRPPWAGEPAGFAPWRDRPAPGPQVSVVIPTFDRAADLAWALTAWAGQQPADLPFELVVVDDGSGDETAELLAGWRHNRFTLRTAHQENRGPAAARNRALELVTAPLVLFAGDDIEPSPGLLAEHLRAHATCGDSGTAVLGRIEWPPGAPLTATMHHVDGAGSQQFSFQHMTDGARYDFRHLYTSNVSLRRELLAKVPEGFSTAYPAAAFEDADLAWRLVPHGLRIVYRRSALAWHHHRYDAPGFYARQVRCGRMAWVLYRRFPELASHLPVAELEAYRRDAAPAAPTELEDLEGRMLALAAAVDGLPQTVADPLLLAVFRHGLLRGLAEAAYGPELAARVSAAVLSDLLPPALAEAIAAAGDRGEAR